MYYCIIMYTGSGHPKHYTYRLVVCAKKVFANLQELILLYIHCIKNLLVTIASHHINQTIYFLEEHIYFIWSCYILRSYQVSRHKHNRDALVGVFNSNFIIRFLSLLAQANPT